MLALARTEGAPLVVDEGGDEGAAVIWLQFCPLHLRHVHARTHRHARTLRSLAPHLETPATSLLMNINSNLMNVKETVGCWLRCDHIYTVHTHRHKRAQDKESTAGHGSVNYTLWSAALRWPFTVGVCPVALWWQLEAWRLESLTCQIPHDFVNVEESCFDNNSFSISSYFVTLLRSNRCSLGTS